MLIANPGRGNLQAQALRLASYMGMARWEADTATRLRLRFTA